MSRVIIGAIAMLLAVVQVSAQSFEEMLDNSPRHLEDVDISVGDDDKVTAFVAYPERSDAADSVVIIHDIRGMSDWVRAAADKLAADGYLAIVPDLLSGKGPDGGNTDSFDANGVRSAIRELNADQVTQRLRACVAYARALPSTTNTVSVGGFCWGGSQTFAYATNDESIKAAFVFYGGPPEDDAMERIACPVYGFYGENDNRINSTIDATTERMKELGKTYEPVIYPGMGHGFVRPGISEDASPEEEEQTAKAWERWLALLAK